MDNYEGIGKSIWNTYKAMAYCLLGESMKQAKRDAPTPNPHKKTALEEPGGEAVATGPAPKQKSTDKYPATRKPKRTSFENIMYLKKNFP